jgi:hypothetical protein
LRKELKQADLPRSEKYIEDHLDYSSFHVLFALREYFPEKYARTPEGRKAKVLCDALRKARSGADWGILLPEGCHMGPALSALVDIGSYALPYLEDLLDDDSPIRLSGSKEATASIRYDYRRSDYAFLAIVSILGLDEVFNPDPAVRAKDVALLKSKLHQRREGQRP